MSGISVSLASISNQFALKSWVDSRSCPRKEFFAFIAGARQLVQAMLGANAPEAANAVVVMLSTVIALEGSLEHYVLNGLRKSVSSEEEWERVVLAAAWRVHEAYDDHTKGGTRGRPA